MSTMTEERLAMPATPVAVVQGGDGHPLLYLHSVLGETAPDLEVLEGLAESFRVIAPILPGFESPTEGRPFRDIVDAVLFVIDLYEDLVPDSAPPLIVGASLGGWLAAEIAGRYPTWPAGLVLVNPVGLLTDGVEVPELFGLQPGALADLLFGNDHAGRAKMLREAQSILDQGQVPPFTMLEPQLRCMAATARLAWNPYLHDPRLPGLLRRVRVPTLVVHGRDDRLMPKALAQAYAAGIEGAAFVELEGAGHMLPLEQPAALVGLIHQFHGHDRHERTER